MTNTSPKYAPEVILVGSAPPEWRSAFLELVKIWHERSESDRELYMEVCYGEDAALFEDTVYRELLGCTDRLPRYVASILIEQVPWVEREAGRKIVTYGDGARLMDDIRKAELMKTI